MDHNQFLQSAKKSVDEAIALDYNEEYEKA